MYRHTSKGRGRLVCTARRKHKEPCGDTPVQEDDLKVAFVTLLNKLAFSQTQTVARYRILDEYTKRKGKQDNAADRLGEIDAELSENRDEQTLLAALALAGRLTVEHRHRKQKLLSQEQKLLDEQSLLQSRAGQADALREFIIMAVRVIKATRPQAAAAGSETKRLRVAAYCRVSTDQEEQETSYEAQCRHYTDYINANPEWELAGIFADEGISGTSSKNRTQFNAMIAACERGEVDMVITKSISRFARNTLDCLTYIRKLKALNIPVYFEKENINTLDAKGEILLTIMASIAQQESLSISQNVRMGIQYGFQEGRMRLDYLNTEIGRLQAERNGLMLERAEYSYRELQIRLLLELVNEMETAAKRCRDLFGTAEDIQRDAKLSHLNVMRGEASVQYDASCADYDEFFRRTYVDLPDGMLDMMGGLVKFDDAMVLKFVDHLTVTDDGFDVIFKAGIAIHVKVTNKLRALGRQTVPETVVEENAGR